MRTDLRGVANVERAMRRAPPEQADEASCALHLSQCRHLFGSRVGCYARSRPAHRLIRPSRLIASCRPEMENFAVDVMLVLLVIFTVTLATRSGQGGSWCMRRWRSRGVREAAAGEVEQA